MEFQSFHVIGEIIHQYLFVGILIPLWNYILVVSILFLLNLFVNTRKHPSTHPIIAGKRAYILQRRAARGFSRFV